MKIALIVLFFVNAFIHLYACFFSHEKLRMATKPPITLLLIAIYVYCALSADINAFVVLGLVFGLIGDILLMFAAKNHAFFMAGACSFAAGHVLYITALCTGTPIASLSGAGAFLPVLPFAAVFLAALAAVYIALFPRLTLNKRVLMPVYLLLICIFGTLAGLGLVRFVLGGFLCMLIGAALFLASDSILSFEAFKGSTKRGNCYVMFTYIAAQALITLGFIII